VSPPSDESCCLADNHLPVGLVKQSFDSWKSLGHDILVS
jgi:hypothetical protein